MTLETTRLSAPDTGTLANATKLARPQSWIIAERNDRALWGEIKGSVIYKTTVDLGLDKPAYKCSCPVKKFPCKHALALLLMAADEADPRNFAQNSPPQWVIEWLDSRDKRSLAKAIPRTEEQIARAETSKTKLRNERADAMQAGIADLKMRLLDFIRAGLVETITPENLNNFAERMVDAKLGGIGRQARIWADLAAERRENSLEICLNQFGMLFLWAKAFEKIDDFPEALQADLLTQAGVNIKKEDLLQQTGVIDDWLVMGQIEMPLEQNLTERRVWLLGKNTKLFVLQLDFSFGSMGFPQLWFNGSAYRGEAVFYPSATPLRVVFKNIESTSLYSQLVGYHNFIDFLNHYSIIIAANPWLPLYPVLWTSVVLVFQQNTFLLVDNDKKQVKITADTEGGDAPLWKLLTISGGQPVSVFGEWNGESLRPLSAFAQGEYYNL